MRQYHKIQTVYKRDPETKHKTLLEGDWSMPEFGLLKDVLWLWDEKVDGTNIRVQYTPEDEISFGGKSDNAQIPAFLVKRLQEEFLDRIGVSGFQEQFPQQGGAPGLEVCLYGEGHGARIQKGGGNYIRDGQDFVLFDVWISGWWLKREDVRAIGEKFGIRVVPEIGRGTLTEAVEFCRKGFDSTWGPFKAEGLILRPAVELQTRSGKRIISKIKYKDFPR